MFGVRVMISSWLKEQQATIREFPLKTLAEESIDLFANWKLYNGTIVDTWFSRMGYVFFNDTFILFFLNLEFWIVNLQTNAREFSWKNPAKKIAVFRVK